MTSIPTPGSTLSALLRLEITDHSHHGIGHVEDVVVTLGDGPLARVAGLVISAGERRIFVPVAAIAAIDGDVRLSKTSLDLRAFARRDGEVLLREDVLDHRVLDLDNARLSRVSDIVVGAFSADWAVVGVDTHRPGLWQRLTDHGQHTLLSWDRLQPLVGHEPSRTHRVWHRALTELKPADIADLLESANQVEQDEILHHLHTRPELEADVFEELDDERQQRLLTARSDAEVADVLTRMNADDAADAVMDLDHDRRRTVLDRLPQATRARIVSLLGYAEDTAGGLMSLDFLSFDHRTVVADALDAVRHARDNQPEALTSVFVVDAQRHLEGRVSLVALIQADPDTSLLDLVVHDPVCVLASADIVALTRVMADHNLLLLPVVDDTHRLLGVVTVDDALEIAIPPSWRQRDPGSAVLRGNTRRASNVRPLGNDH